MGRIDSISFNINGGNPPPNRDYIYDFMRNKYEPTAALIMDNRDAAVNMAGNRNIMVTHRSYSDIEHELWARETPKQFCDRELSWGNPEVYRHALNEPAIGDRRLITWLTEVGNRHVDNGYGIVLLNVSVGGYEKYHIESGYFDDLLRLVCVPNNRVYLGIHEYCSILLPYGIGKWSKEQLYDKNAVQPQYWPKPSELPIARERGDLPSYWHFLRSSWFTIRAQEMGFGTPKFWVTESGWDSLPDMGAQGILDHFKDKYGIPAPYGSLRGLNTLRPIWADYFPQWTFEQCAFEQLKWLASIYPSNYVGHCLFTVTNAHDWKIDAGTDYSELYELQRLLLNAKGQDVPDTIQWKDITLATKGDFANVRETPNTINDSNIIGRITSGTQLQHAPSNAVGWWYVKLSDGKIGYISETVAYDPASIPEREYNVIMKESEVKVIKALAKRLP